MNSIFQMRWTDGDTEMLLIETATELHISTISGQIKTHLATYGRGEIRSIVDFHSTQNCTLRIRTDGGLDATFRCPPEACVVLLVKLRKFQGANHEATLPEAELFTSNDL